MAVFVALPLVASTGWASDRPWKFPIQNIYLESNGVASLVTKSLRTWTTTRPDCSRFVALLIRFCLNKNSQEILASFRETAQPMRASSRSQ